METIKVAETDASELFVDDYGNETLDLKYCREFHSFSHSTACEFILHLSPDHSEYFEDEISQMKKYGCSERFIHKMRQAQETGAVYVLLYT